jgi:hypothetical protein
MSRRIGVTWVERLKAVLLGDDPAGLVCPRCGSVGLDLFCHVALPETRMGWCVIRCAACSHGLWFSRLVVPFELETTADPASWPDTILD